MLWIICSLYGLDRARFVSIQSVTNVPCIFERALRMNLEPILALALETCRAVKADEFCYSWLDDNVKKRGVAPSHLKQLAKLGLLVRVDGSRGGHRAYYRLSSAAAKVVAAAELV